MTRFVSALTAITLVLVAAAPMFYAYASLA